MTASSLRAALCSALRDALLDAWAVLLPIDCAGCGAADRALCAGCLGALAAHPLEQFLPDGTRVVSALRYEGAVRQAVLALKEHGRTDVARRLAAPLGCAVLAATAGLPPGPPIEAVAVPTSRAAYRRRGYDPVALLLRAAGYRRARLLVPVRRSAQQKALSIEARAANRAGSLRAVRRLDGRRLLLIDDVVTTGATLGEAARALRAAGAEVVAAATLASTPRRSGTPRDASLNIR